MIPISVLSINKDGTTMTDRLLCLVLFGAVLFGLTDAAPLNTNEVEARQFAAKVSEQLFAYYDKVSDNIFSVDGKVPGSALNGITTILKTAEALVGIVNDSKAFDYTQFKDKELKYIFKIIRRSADEAIVGNENILLMIVSLAALQELANEEVIEAYKDSSFKLAYSPDVQEIIAKSKNSDELKYYWNIWKEKNNEWAKINFVLLTEIIKQAAKLSELPVMEYWLNEYTISEMEHVMTQIEPFYRQMHAFIRNQLIKKYGEEVIKPTGPIPDHLFQQVLAQIWTNGSIIDELYPHKDLPPYDSILENNQYDTIKIYKSAEHFYESLGFESISDDLWNKHIKMNTKPDVGECKATLYDLSSNVYMEYCQKMDFKKFIEAHGYMGRITYAREKRNLPAYYFRSHGLEYSIGEAVTLSASTPKHLNAIGMVIDFKFTDEVLINRLLRMGIHTFLNIPLYFVHTKVLADIYTETVKLENVNTHYWNLMDKYVGVEPPIDRGLDSLDFPHQFYLDLTDNEQANKFDSEVLGYQFYERFCEISGQYPKEPIQNCDFYGSKSVGDAMKKMMQLGSSKPLHDVLAIILHENTTLNADSLLEYYRPIKTWLTDKNHADNVKVGWTHTDKKIC